MGFKKWGADAPCRIFSFESGTNVIKSQYHIKRMWCIRVSRILKSKLDHFVKFGGYETVKKIKRGKHKGEWRGVSEASRKTGVTRPTIYKILEEYPEKPSRVEPKYVENLKESEGFKRLEQMYSKSICQNSWVATVTTALKAFRILGYNRDPISWTEEDYKTLWYHEEFHSDECKGINKIYAVPLRRLMRATENHDFLAKFKFNNPPEGKKKNWFLHDEDIKALVPKIEQVDTLMFFFTGLAVGARASALLRIDSKDLDTIDDVLQVYEPKVKAYVLKFPPKALVNILHQYIKDYDIGANQKLFPNSYSYYVDNLKAAGKAAGLRKKVTTHILKHTYVTQANRHGVSAETIVHQTGTELRCLEKFYRATNESKLRHEMQGREYKFKPFPEWVSELSYFVRIQYTKLRDLNRQTANTVLTMPVTM